ncbi:MAG TPA: DUF4412 domain-containing protein [Desulfatiglandales bacterium]|nr:DUF4412 domain-containing protein [Desulfatiglandales bacterium]
MKKVLKFIVFAAVIFLSINTWAGEKMKEATVEYSADMIMETGQGTMNSKVYHALGGKDRQEMSVGGSTQIMIMRLDKKVGWVLMPAQKSYMEMSLDESKQKSGTNVNDCDMNISPLGDETVNGVKATKSKVSMSCPDNENYDGNMWVTKDGIMVKMDAVAGQGSKQTRLKIDLKNLKIGKQDPSLFEIPAGYQKFGMKNISSMMKSAQEQAAQGAKEENANESEGQSTEKEPEGTDKVTDTINKLKGIFGK